MAITTTPVVVTLLVVLAVLLKLEVVMHCCRQDQRAARKTTRWLGSGLRTEAPVTGASNAIAKAKRSCFASRAISASAATARRFVPFLSLPYFVH